LTELPVRPPLLQAFDFQIEWCRLSAPFTSRVLARSREWLLADEQAHAAFCAVVDDPLAGAVPLRWAGALHHLALRGLRPWADWWPPAGAAPAADAVALALDAALDAAIRRAWTEHCSTVQAALALPPQTNEVKRSAALLPGLLHIAAATGLPLNLLEIGASAGLNLWCDRYFHRHPDWSWGDPAAPLTLTSEWRGQRFTEAGANLQIARRAACDASPIDLSVSDEGLRLASFIWPEQAERMARLHAARVAAARWMDESGVRVESLPAAAFVERELRTAAGGQATVLMHSVVWQYIAPSEQAGIRKSIEAAGARATARAPLAWLRMEPPTPDSKVELRCRIWPGGIDRQLAVVHPHGAWIDWSAAA
jgi:hypothetical protein